MKNSIVQQIRVQEVLDAFDDAWRANRLRKSAEPEIATYAARIPDPVRLHGLVQLIAVDMEYRHCIQRDPAAHRTARQVEDYLDTFAELRQEAEAIIELVCAELRCLSRLGCAPPIEEYLTRFPALQGLTQQLMSTTADLQSEQIRGKFDLPGFQLLKEAGRGGRGVVYQAWQQSLKRYVAIKVLKPTCLRSEDDRRRLKREGETLAKFQHPNIVKLFAVETIAEQNFLVMEWIEGQSLEVILQQTEITVIAITRIMHEVCAAVEHAHQHGILHRDIKPANILISHTGDVLITDFGLAKDVDPVLANETASITRTREIIGTPSFMPPEQVDSRAGTLGPWTDVYAIGATLYCGLTGRPPLRGSTMWETFELVLKDTPVSPRKLNPSVSKDLETVCLKCLAKQPGERYQSALELGLEIQRILRGEPVHARPISSFAKLYRWSRKSPREAILFLATLSAVALVCITSTIGSLVFSRLYYSEQSQRQLAADSLAQAQTSQYASHIREAQLQFELKNLSGMLQALEEVVPKDGTTDRRDWEWHYLHSLSNQGNQPFVLVEDGSQWVGAFDITRDAKFLAAGSTVPWYESMDQRAKAQLAVWNTADHSQQLLVQLPGNACSDVTINPAQSLVAACVHLARRAKDPIAPDRNSGSIGYESSQSSIEIYDIKAQERVLTISLEHPEFMQLQFGGSEPILLGLSPTHLTAFSVHHGKILWSVAGITSFRVVGELVQVVGIDDGYLKIVNGQPTDGAVIESTTFSSFKFARSIHEIEELPLTLPIKHFPSPTGQMSASAHGNFLFTETSSEDAVRTKLKIDASTSACTFSSDDNLVAVGRSDGVVEVWDLASKSRLWQKLGHSSHVHCLQFTRENSSLISAGWDGKLLLWDLDQNHKSSQIYGESIGSEQAFEAFTVTPDHHLRGVQLSKPGVVNWQLGKPGLTILDSSSPPIPSIAPQRAASISTDGTQLICISIEDKKLAVCWDLKKNEQIHAFKTEHSLRFVDMGSFGAYASCASWGFGDQMPEARVQVVRLSDRSIVLDQLFPGRRVWRTSINDPHRLLAVIDVEPESAQANHLQNRQNTLTLWNLESPTLLWQQPLTHPTGLYLGLALASDGSKLAVGEFGGAIEIRDTHTGRVLVSLERGMKNLEFLSFSPNGRRLVGVSRKEIVIWDTGGGYRLLTLPMQQPNFDPIYNPQAKFSADGRMLISNQFDQTLRVITTTAP